MIEHKYQAPEDRWRDEAKARPLGMWAPPKPPKPAPVTGRAFVTSVNMRHPDPLRSVYYGEIIGWNRHYEGTFKIIAQGDLALAIAQAGQQGRPITITVEAGYP